MSTTRRPACGRYLAHQVVGVAGLADDLEARLLEQAHHALAQQHRVVGHDYPHGILAVIVVPRAGRRVDLEAAVDDREPVGEAAQAGAVVRVGAADAVVGHLDHHAAVVARHLDRRVARRRVLGDVRQRLGHHEVGGQLDRPRAAARRTSRAARPAAGRAGRASRAPRRRPRSLSTAGWMPRASSRSSAERRVQLLAGAVEQLLGGVGVLAHRGCGPGACRAPSRRAAAGRRRAGRAPGAGAPRARCASMPLARGAQLLHLRAQLGVEALVLERERRGRADRVDVARGSSRSERVVHDRRHALAVALDRASRPPGARARAGRPRGPWASTKRSPPAASRRARATGRRARARARRAARRAGASRPAARSARPRAALDHPRPDQRREEQVGHERRTAPSW